MAKLPLSKTKQLTSTSIICAIAACAPFISSDLYAQSSILQQEVNRRASDAKTAQELLLSGDIAYNKQDHETAVKDYADAFRLLPNGTLNAELRTAAADRYATAATERSRRLVKFGHYDEARDLLKAVLNAKVAPHHLGAKKLSLQLDDPIRYNPALTPDHVTDVVKVGQLLREGEGFYSLGQYDRAQESYSDVLRIDPYNKAARRSLEKVNSAQSNYQNAARDQTRSSLLKDTSKQWESTIPKPNNALPAEFELETNSSASLFKTNLSDIIIENVFLDQIDIEEAIDFVRIQSKSADRTGEQNGINIIVNLGSADAATAKAIKDSRISIQATNLPLTAIFDYIADQTGTKWRQDDTAVIFSALKSSNDTMISRTFRVPPTFLAGSSASSSDSAEDIFGNNGNNQAGKLAETISAKAYLIKNGIPFPDGATAKYISSSSSLIVRNTARNMDAVAEIVSISANTEQVQVVTKTTIIRITETKLKELGFDWLLAPAGLGSSLLSGGTIGIGGTGNLIPGSDVTPPITAGLRSGSDNELNNALDTFLNAENSGFRNLEARAPSILSLTHIVGGAQLQVIMRGLNQSKGADIMVQPSIVSRSGERASVNSVREVIYPTEYEPPEIAQPNPITFIGVLTNGTIVTATQPDDTIATPAHPTAFTTRNTGVNLEVEATVDDNKNFINLSLLPELVEFEGHVNYGSAITGTSGSTLGFNAVTGFFVQPGNSGDISPNFILMPVFRTITTGNISATVQDGQTVVLAGLVTSKKTKTEDKIPLLGDLPIAGRLFRTEGSNTVKEAVIIMVNSEIIDPTGQPWRNR